MAADRRKDISVSAGDYRITFGNKYCGKRLSEIELPDLEQYLNWLTVHNRKAGSPIPNEVRTLARAVKAYKMEKLYGADGGAPLDPADPNTIEAPQS